MLRGPPILRNQQGQLNVPWLLVRIWGTIFTLQTIRSPYSERFAPLWDLLRETLFRPVCSDGNLGSAKTRDELPSLIRYTYYPHLPTSHLSNA